MTKISNLSALCFEAEEKQQIEDLLRIVIREFMKGYDNE